MRGRAGTIQQSARQQTADALIDSQHERERAEAPTRRDLGQQAVLPLPPAGQQFGLYVAGQVLDQHGALLVDRRLQLLDGRHRLVDAGAAGVERIGHQIEKVRPADAVAGGAGHLAGEQVQQVGELPSRLQAGLGVGQCAERIDAEDAAFWSALPPGEG